MDARDSLVYKAKLAEQVRAVAVYSLPTLTCLHSG
jgi:hypothetical protein